MLTVLRFCCFDSTALTRVAAVQCVASQIEATSCRQVWRKLDRDWFPHLPQHRASGLLERLCPMSVGAKPSATVGEEGSVGDTPAASDATGCQVPTAAAADSDAPALARTPSTAALPSAIVAAATSSVDPATFVCDADPAFFPAPLGHHYRNVWAAVDRLDEFGGQHSSYEASVHA